MYVIDSRWVGSLVWLTGHRTWVWWWRRSLQFRCMAFSRRLQFRYVAFSHKNKNLWEKNTLIQIFYELVPHGGLICVILSLEERMVQALHLCQGCLSLFSIVAYIWLLCCAYSHWEAHWATQRASYLQCVFLVICNCRKVFAFVCSCNILRSSSLCPCVSMVTGEADSPATHLQTKGENKCVETKHDTIAVMYITMRTIATRLLPQDYCHKEMQ